MIEIIGGYLQKLSVHIYNMGIMTQILSNFPEAYKNIVEYLEDEPDENVDPLNIERVCDKLSEK